MALTEAQTITCLLVLDLPARTDVSFAYQTDPERMRDAEIVRHCLDTLTSDQEDMVTAILDQWSNVEYDTDTLNAEGLNSDPSRTRGLIARRLCNAIGWAPTAGSGGWSLSRG